MLTDVGGLALSLLAIRFAARPATPQRTFGYLRMEVLSALANAVVLLLLTVYILYEAYQRFLSPPEVLSGPMLLVAAIGLAVNLVSMRLLSSGSTESLNVKGAYFEVLSDMPLNVDVSSIETKLLTIPGTVAIHDLRVWTLTSGFDAMSCQSRCRRHVHRTGGASGRQQNHEGRLPDRPHDDPDRGRGYQSRGVVLYV